MVSDQLLSLPSTLVFLSVICRVHVPVTGIPLSEASVWGPDGVKVPREGGATVWIGGKAESSNTVTTKLAPPADRFAKRGMVMAGVPLAGVNVRLADRSGSLG